MGAIISSDFIVKYNRTRICILLHPNKSVYFYPLPASYGRKKKVVDLGIPS